MIPLLGIPYVNRFDLLEKTLASIDIEIGRLIVIDNSRTGELTGQLSWPNMTLITPHHNLGVAASWNLIIKASPTQNWWAIINSDLEFEPGDLARLSDHMTEPQGVGLLDSFAAFGVAKKAIERAGWFDENFVPAYCEDNDFRWRCQLVGVPVVILSSGARHYGSAVIRSDELYWSQNAVSFPNNVEYYQDKWGGLMGEERYETPFNRGGDPREWRLDMRRLASHTWR